MMTSTFSGEGVGVVALPPAVPRSLHRTLLPLHPSRRAQRDAGCLLCLAGRQPATSPALSSLPFLRRWNEHDRAGFQGCCPAWSCSPTRLTPTPIR